jgi:aminodeoxyfutalosine deaminase
MPKVELHVHLEGTIDPATLWRIIERNSIDIGVGSEQDVARLFTYSDFAHFIDIFTMCSDCLRTADDIASLVLAYGLELARQNVRYAEIHFNPEPHARRRGIAMPDALAKMNCARERISTDHGVELRWIVDGVRDAVPGPSASEQAVDFMIEAGHDSGIVALGLGGNEIGKPPAPFANAFRRAHEAGFHVVAHAGEAVGPESIWDAVTLLNAERIGHGITAAQDPALLAYLQQHRIPLEISPTSNLRTGVVHAIDEIPFATFLDAGVQFSINSDDPPMFGTDLVSEYALVASALNLDRSGVASLVASAIDQSFADVATKSRLHRELREHTPLD